MLREDKASFARCLNAAALIRGPVEGLGVGDIPAACEAVPFPLSLPTFFVGREPGGLERAGLTRQGPVEICLTFFCRPTTLPDFTTPAVMPIPVSLRIDERPRFGLAGCRRTSLTAWEETSESSRIALEAVEADSSDPRRFHWASMNAIDNFQASPSSC
jgi:hypothetical protein